MISMRFQGVFHWQVQIPLPMKFESKYRFKQNGDRGIVVMLIFVFLHPTTFTFFRRCSHCLVFTPKLIKKEREKTKVLNLMEICKV